MAVIVKEKNQPITEELLNSLIGKFVHVPTNIHTAPNVKDPNKIDQINAWFGGKIGGYEKAVIAFDYEKQEMMDEPKVYFNCLLTDGMGYILADDAEVREISENEFADMVAQFQAENAVAEIGSEIMEIGNEPKELIIPGEKKIETPKIILPGDSK